MRLHVVTLSVIWALSVQVRLPGSSRRQHPNSIVGASPFAAGNMSYEALMSRLRANMRDKSKSAAVALARKDMIAKREQVRTQRA